MDVTLTELEAAINYWRRMKPATGDERALSPEVNALADAYALMIFQRSKVMPLSSLSEAALALIEAWRLSAKDHAA
jgi:hypothetical protein